MQSRENRRAVAAGASCRIARRNGRKVRPLLALSCVAVLCGCRAEVSMLQSERPAPIHVFQLTDPPPYLTDQLALEKAREAMQLDGFNADAWTPTPLARRTLGPDGTPDQY